MFALLIYNQRVLSKSYYTLDASNAVKPEFKVLHYFTLQSTSYLILKIAKYFAQQEIKTFLETNIIKSSPNYSFLNFGEEKTLLNVD